MFRTFNQHQPDVDLLHKENLDQYLTTINMSFSREIMRLKMEGSKVEVG